MVEVEVKVEVQLEVVVVVKEWSVVVEGAVPVVGGGGRVVMLVGCGHRDHGGVSIPIACQKDSLADVVFLVDQSVGTRQNLESLQSFLTKVTTSVDVKDHCMRLGLMSYSDGVETISALNSSSTQSEFQDQIQKLSFRAGKSNAGAALKQVRSVGFSASGGSRRAQGVPQIAVLITSRASDDEVREAALDLRLQDVTVFTMSIQGANNTQLEEIASYPPRQTMSTLESYTELEAYSCVDTREADIYFLIDGSTSIKKKQFEQIKEFMWAVIQMFSISPDKVRVGAVQYSHKKQVEFSTNVYPTDSDLKKAVFNIRQLQGSTYTGAALDFMLQKIKEERITRTSKVPCYLIVLTDGKSMDSVLEPAERLRAEQVTIHAIGIGEANKTQLQQITGEEERVSFGQNFDSLKAIKNEVVRSICTEKGCEDLKADVMFLVDSSRSIGLENYEKMKTFMKNLLAKIQIGPDKTQVGVIQFSDYNKEEFQLNKYFTQKEISDAIDRMSLIDGNTLTGSALTFADEYFTHSKGARNGVKKFLILITDGEAQDSVRGPARALRDKEVIIFAVGIHGANRSQLEEVCGDGSLVFQVENFDHLEAIEKKLIFRVCTLHDCKRINLLDVVFVLDHSSSIQPQQQESMINLTVHLVKKADVGKDRVQFGAVMYSDEPDVLFHLNKYSKKSAIIEDLRRHRTTKGNTYTAKALEYTNSLFTEEHGSRIKQNVKQMLIIITDGESHDRSQLSATALKLRNKGIIIYAVGVGQANQHELETMAGNKNNTFLVDNFDKLKDIYLYLQQRLCINTQESCKLQEADVIFFCDGSDMVSDSEFVTMTTFLSDLIDNFDIQSRKMKIGMAQFGSHYQEIIQLENTLTTTQWKTQIQTVIKSNGFPRIDLALKQVSVMFESSAGGRINSGVPQTLVVITSRDPYYNVEDAVEILKKHGICVLVLGIGDVHKEQLLPITGNPEKIITFQDFNKLKNVDVKNRMVREICQSCGKTNCFVDVVVGFDLSTHWLRQHLFHGHPQLESYLPGILKDLTSVRGVSCGAGAEVQVSIAFKVNNDQEFPARFQIYQRMIFDHLLQVTVNGPSHLNAQFLQYLWDTFEDKSASRGQVLLIFSDGLGGESIPMLENQSDRLREAGALDLVSVGLLVADAIGALAKRHIPTSKAADVITKCLHLTFGRPVPLTDLNCYLVLGGNIAERTCCCTFCKCSGSPGPHGTQGSLALKVVK
ncbi:hypothetical protein MC885_017703 [Smutsia gigantea]|nr:hypothetical protein MC885_017703 [Smutsia gigantea]